MRLTNVLVCMSFKDLHAHLLKPIGNTRILQIGAGDTKAEIDQHFGNSGHADAPDANKVNVLNATEHLFNQWSVVLGIGPILLGAQVPASFSIMSTAAAAASPSCNLRIDASISSTSDGCCAS